MVATKTKTATTLSTKATGKAAPAAKGTKFVTRTDTSLHAGTSGIDVGPRLNDASAAVVGTASSVTQATRRASRAVSSKVLEKCQEASFLLDTAGWKVVPPGTPGSFVGNWCGQGPDQCWMLEELTAQAQTVANANARQAQAFTEMAVASIRGHIGLLNELAAQRFGTGFGLHFVNGLAGLELRLGVEERAGHR